MDPRPVWHTDAHMLHDARNTNQATQRRKIRALLRYIQRVNERVLLSQHPSADLRCPLLGELQFQPQTVLAGHIRQPHRYHRAQPVLHIDGHRSHGSRQRNSKLQLRDPLSHRRHQKVGIPVEY